MSVTLIRFTESFHDCPDAGGHRWHIGASTQHNGEWRWAVTRFLEPRNQETGRYDKQVVHAEGTATNRIDAEAMLLAAFRRAVENVERQAEGASVAQALAEAS